MKTIEYVRISGVETGCLILAQVFVPFPGRHIVRIVAIVALIP